MPSDPNVVIGTSAWVENKGKLLMLERLGTHADGYGTWGIPGGWLDHGEDDLWGAVRETFEETGVVVEPVSRLPYVVGKSDDGSRTIVTLYIKCKYISGTPTVMEPEKTGEVGWIYKDYLYEMNLFAPLQQFINENGYYLL